MKIPNRIPTVTADLYIQAAVDSGVGEFVIQMELAFDHALDADRLSTALDLMLDAEPVLGCRLELESPKTFWQRLSGPERKSFLCVSTGQEYLNFRHSGQDSCKGPQLQACLWRKSGGDSLVLKVCHQVSDAGGVKDIVAKLSSIYNRLEKEPDYKPEPNLSGCRDYGQMMRYIPFYAYPIIFFNFLRYNMADMLGGPSHILPLPECPVEPLTYVIKHIPAERTEKIAHFGKARDATINDLIIAAHYRALLKEAPWDGKSTLRFRSSMDLRHWYLPDEKAEGICNLSVEEYPNLGKEPGGNFEETLDRLSSYTRGRKKNWRCLSELCLLPLIKPLSYKNMKKWGTKFMEKAKKNNGMPNGLTNMGVIHPEKVSFGMAPKTAWLLAPFFFPPLLVGGLSGYQGSLTLSAGAPVHVEKIIDRFCETVIANLPT